MSRPRRRFPLSQDLSQEFVSSLASRIEEIEKAAAGNGGPAEREAVKARRKQLKEIIKFCSDKANSAEDRIAFVQSKYSTQLADLLRFERQVRFRLSDFSIAGWGRPRGEIRRRHAPSSSCETDSDVATSR
jgi:hypothetical protein